jgi:hypothetical protein
MQRSLATLLAAAVAAVFATAGGVRAEDFPWSYSGTGTNIFNNNNGDASSAIHFVGTSGGATGDSGIIIYNLSTESTATLAAPDNFKKVHYDLQLTLGDTKSLGKPTTSGTLKFQGEFSAQKVSKDSFLSPINTWLSPTSQSIILGSADTGFRKYTVDILSFTPPGKPGSGLGSIYAEVRIAPSGNSGGSGDDGNGGGGGTPPAAPEPGTLVLAGLGLPAIGLFLRRRKNRADAVPIEE